jgi:hypothetical protein
MAEQVCRLKCFSVGVPNKPGAAASVLSVLKAAGVDLVAFWGYPAGKGHSQLDMIPLDVKAFSAALRKAKIKVIKKQAAFLLHGEDRTGALADGLAKVSAAGVNLQAVQAVSAGEGLFGAVLYTDAKDVRKAGKALGA